MIMVRTPDRKVYQPGLEKIKEIIGKRVRQFAPKLSLDTEIFDSRDTLEQLCLMSGGHVRNLLYISCLYKFSGQRNHIRSPFVKGL